MLLACVSARANTVIFTWSELDSQHNYTLAGKVTFGIANDDVNGNCLSGGCELTVTVENTAPQAIGNQPDFLDGIYWAMTQGSTSATGGTAPGQLTLASAVAPIGLVNALGNTVTAGTANSNICAPDTGGSGIAPSCSSTVVGGYQAAYSTTGVNGKTGYQYALSTTGQGTYWKGGDVGSFNYSIIPSSGVSKGSDFPYVLDKANFVFTGLNSSRIYISSVEGAYGTTPDFTPYSTLVSGESPEPGTIALVAGALLLLLARKRRRA